MDPAALGTTRIGLDGIRRDQDSYDHGEARMVRSARPRHSVRRIAASALRRAAAVLEPAAGSYGVSASDG